MCSKKSEVGRQESEGIEGRVAHCGAGLQACEVRLKALPPDVLQTGTRVDEDWVR